MSQKFDALYLDTHYTERYTNLTITPEEGPSDMAKIQPDNAANILKTALLLFASEGYENTGVQRIVTACGITKPTLYHYFGSKRGLLEAIFSQMLDPFLEELRENALYRGDVTMSLRSVTESYFIFALRNPEFYRFFLAGTFSPAESELNSVISQRVSLQYDLIRQLFLEATRDHGNMSGRSEPYAISFLGMINSYVTTAFHGNMELTDQTVIQVCHQFMHGIFS